jgi:hypothetical protein
MMNRGNTPGTVTQPPVVQQTTAPIDAAASGTGTAIAFATGTANLPSISPEEAIALHKSGTAKFIDVRGANLYGQQHIAGAVNVPQSAIFEPSNIKEFPREGNLILYCQ